jgi:hypothetical protein
LAVIIADLSKIVAPKTLEETSVVFTVIVLGSSLRVFLRSVTE